MVSITTIAKTISRGSITITTISSVSQTMPVRYGGSSIGGGDLGDSGGGNIVEAMSISQGGGSSVAETMCCGVANLGDVRNGGGCYGSIAKAVAVAQASTIAVSAVADTSNSTLFLRFFAIGRDGQSQDDGSLRTTDRRRSTQRPVVAVPPRTSLMFTQISELRCSAIVRSVEW